MRVTVNGQEIEAQSTTDVWMYSEVAWIAYPGVNHDGLVILYDSGPPDNPRGVLSPGEAVRVYDGMVFDVSLSYIDRYAGFCDKCGRPVLRPGRIIAEKAARGCVCASPELVTWADIESDYQRNKAERERRLRESPYQPRDNFAVWKKRAKRL